MRRVNLALLLALVGASVAAWPELPERIPVHFGLDGRPDRWADRSFQAWFTVPLLAVGLNLMLMGVGRWSLRRPERLRLPNKARLLELPRGRQEAVLARLRASFPVLALPLTVSMGLVQAGSWVTATGGDGRPILIAVFLVAMLSGPVALIALLVPFGRELDRQHRLEREAAGREKA